MNFIVTIYDNTIKLLEKEKTNYLVCSFFLLFSAGWVIFCYIMNNDAGTIFSRSGSVMVLYGAFSEYILSQIKNNESSRNSSTYKILRVIANLFIMFGTAIWGYGDYATGTTSL